jgi:hypothetical protein
MKPVLHLYVKGITSRSKFFVRHSTIVANRTRNLGQHFFDISKKKKM